MFGYVRPHKSELLVREYAQYKAIYCQLCRVLGQEYGPLARLALSYDCAFYAMLALSVSDEKVEERHARCICNPLKACTYLPCGGDQYKKAAALCVLLTYHKLRDDLADESFGRSLRSRCLLPLVRGKAKKAAARWPELSAAVELAMESQQEAEAQKAGVDRCAEPTAKLLETIFAQLAECDGQRRALGSFGYFLGRWVYLMDAADDLQEDLARGMFNPFIARLGLEGKSTLTEDERKRADEECNAALNATAAQLVMAMNVAELGQFGPIIENVGLKGLAEMQREILFLHLPDAKNRRHRAEI